MSITPASDTPASFARLVHADWSTGSRKRWTAQASRTDIGWRVEAPRQVDDVGVFVTNLLASPRPTLAGFDFPIGVPDRYGRRTGFENFCQAIEKFGHGRWSHFYYVCDRAEDISLYRPFYPRVSSASARQMHLLTALEVDSIDGLRRTCEKATADRRAACSLFWTLGGNQVGKAAISGWRDVIQPARLAGARLWPFEGTLNNLAQTESLVICETYPAEAYGHVGVRFRAGSSKQRQQDRRNATEQLSARCSAFGVELEPKMRAMIDDGFGPRSDGEDPFDAVMGLLGMVEVVQGRRTEAPAQNFEWEGWILGQSA